MDPQIGWFQPEQIGPAKEFWARILESYITKRANGKSGNHEITPNSLSSEKFIENGRRILNISQLSCVMKNQNKASTFYLNKYPELLIGKYGGCPWRTGTPYDTNTIAGLHQEIEQFYQYISPTPEEHQIRVNLVSKVKSIITSLWPNSKVEVFGSFQTALYLPTSDIDMVVIGEWNQLPLRLLQEALLNSGICEPGNIKVLDKASVPIVKFSDSASEIKVDISFNMNNGVKSVELIKHFCDIYPALRKLVLVLKQFLLQRDLNEVFHGGISSYSLILMCVSFLQLHPQQDPCRSDHNLGILLVEFFELYGRRFNYMKTAISVKNGGAYIAKDELQKDMMEGHRPSILSIEDPLTLGNDIGRGSYGALQVKQAFDYAYVVISQAVSMGVDTNKQSILGRIIRVTDKVVDYRIWMRKRFPLNRISSSLQSNDGSTSPLAATDSDSDGSCNGQPKYLPLPLPSPKFSRKPMNGFRYVAPFGHNPGLAGVMRTTFPAYLPTGPIPQKHSHQHMNPIHVPLVGHHQLPHSGIHNSFHRQLAVDMYENSHKGHTSATSTNFNHSCYHKKQKNNQYNRQRAVAEVNYR